MAPRRYLLPILLASQVSGRPLVERDDPVSIWSSSVADVSTLSSSASYSGLSLSAGDSATASATTLPTFTLDGSAAASTKVISSVETGTVASTSASSSLPIAHNLEGAAAVSATEDGLCPAVNVVTVTVDGELVSATESATASGEVGGTAYVTLTDISDVTVSASASSAVETSSTVDFSTTAEVSSSATGVVGGTAYVTLTDISDLTVSALASSTAEASSTVDFSSTAAVSSTAVASSSAEASASTAEASSTAVSTSTAEASSTVTASASLSITVDAELKAAESTPHLTLDINEDLAAVASSADVIEVSEPTTSTVAPVTSAAVSVVSSSSPVTSVAVAVSSATPVTTAAAVTSVAVSSAPVAVSSELVATTVSAAGSTGAELVKEVYKFYYYYRYHNYYRWIEEVNDCPEDIMTAIGTVSGNAVATAQHVTITTYLTSATMGAGGETVYVTTYQTFTTKVSYTTTVQPGMTSATVAPTLMTLSSLAGLTSPRSTAAVATSTPAVGGSTVAAGLSSSSAVVSAITITSSLPVSVPTPTQSGFATVVVTSSAIPVTSAVAGASSSRVVAVGSSAVASGVSTSVEASAAVVPGVVSGFTPGIVATSGAAVASSALVVSSSSVEVLVSSSVAVPVSSAVSTPLSSAVVSTPAVVSSSPATVSSPSAGVATSSLSTLLTVTSSAAAAASSSTSVVSASSLADNIFVAIATDAPPSQITSRADHPVSPSAIVSASSNAKRSDDIAYQTNKFYENFILGTQENSAWLHPYVVQWAKGGSVSGAYGMAIQHTDASGFSYDSGDPARYFVSPVGSEQLILTAVELGSDTTLTVDSLTGFSVNVNLASTSGGDPLITFPLVQGAGFITAIYNGATPGLQSNTGFTSLTPVSTVDGTENTFKYTVVLDNGITWLIYLTGDNVPTLTLLNGAITSTGTFSGIMQVAKVPTDDSDAATTYDQSAGVYATSASISASVAGTTATYQLSWTKAGNTDRTLLMFALPHHQASFDSTTSAAQTAIELQTTTKGVAAAVLKDSWTLVESDLPTDMGFGPWSPTTGAVTSLSDTAKAAVNSAAAYELAEDIVSQTDLDSMYYSGKAFAKFAMAIVTVNDLGGDTSLAQSALTTLKSAFSTFISNTQNYPLVYDSVWKGAVSSASYTTGDSGSDFGNTYYNDHHFHYGYFVYTAAVLGYLDPDWLTDGTNKAWVNMLVRDFANPSTEDPYFPFSRSFDWYHGHSWAKGLFESADGKDEESSSEDAFASYAIKMWGKVSGDANMEARGNLMLKIQARSLQSYFLMAEDNTVQPSKFIGNRVTGILFENKCDHVTYFGTNTEYIEGIHMIPLNPSSPLTRTATFVAEEWSQYFADDASDPASAVAGGWRGILYANLAISDPVTSYNFFAQSDFDYDYLDGGASRTWYLAFAAGLGGA